MTDKAAQTCFVVMGFGRKADFRTGRTLDLDKTYRLIIKPVAEDVGLSCLRADEIVHPGSIDLSIYRQLMVADVVVADISACIPNALYELGVRHALRPYATIIIAEDQMSVPSDLFEIMVHKYQHLGMGLDSEEVTRFRAVLSEAMRTILDRTEADSPVYRSLPGLHPPLLEAMAGETEARTPVSSPVAEETAGTLTQRAEAALQGGQFDDARALFSAARSLQPNDAFLTQRLALATYKSGVPTVRDALEDATAILLQLEPENSNDPATIGLWAAVHKRLWRESGERRHLDTAIVAFERGFDIGSSDYYSGINLAVLLNVRARISGPAEQITDFVNAERVRRRVIMICEAILDDTLNADDRFWIEATLAEAYLGVGDFAASERWLKDSEHEVTADWMREAAQSQLAALRKLLVPSPLEMIRAPS